MKFRKRPMWIALLCSVLSVFACVTINIYFPAEQVESIAGEIVDDIRGRESTSMNQPSIHSIKIVFSTSTAWAQDVVNVSNPTIRNLKEKMKSRYSKLKPYYNDGILKEGNDGYLSIENDNGLKLKEKRDLNNLVNAENKDRKTLYSEVAKALKIEAGQVSKIAEIFAKEWQK
ncbi:DUF1318 domain-containing protein [Thermodesulfobacteriota bacterium]